MINKGDTHFQVGRQVEIGVGSQQFLGVFEHRLDDNPAAIAHVDGRSEDEIVQLKIGGEMI